MISDVASSSQGKTKKGFDRKRLLSGLLAGAFGLLVVGLGGWWFTLALGVIVHLGLLEFFRMAQFKGMRPATKSDKLGITAGLSYGRGKQIHTCICTQVYNLALGTYMT